MSRNPKSETEDSAASLWLWVGTAFFVLIVMFAIMITLALTHRPERIEAPPPPSAQGGATPAQSPAIPPEPNRR